MCVGGVGVAGRDRNVNTLYQKERERHWVEGEKGRVSALLTGNEYWRGPPRNTQGKMPTASSAQL